MMDTEAFKEFKTGLTLLRDNYANRALNHIQKAAELEKNNPYYMSYLGVALARTQQLLITRDAQAFYETHGFVQHPFTCMRRPPANA